jgi:AraC-like DNA-binding protein
MDYRETVAPAALRGLVECGWTAEGRGRARILPDGCMDLIEMNGTIVVAGPDTAAFVSDPLSPSATGLRFRPGVLPRLIGLPAAELRNTRIPLHDLRPDIAHGPLLGIAAKMLGDEPAKETAPWSLPQLTAVTARLARGASVRAVADEIGWSARNMQRQCAAVYGYGPATLRRVLRFRRAVAMLRAGLPVADTAARAGYADQPHLHREVYDLAGVQVAAVRQVSSAANRSTVVPSGSATLA